MAPSVQGVAAGRQGQEVRAESCLGRECGEPGWRPGACSRPGRGAEGRVQMPTGWPGPGLGHGALRRGETQLVDGSQPAPAGASQHHPSPQSEGSGDIGHPCASHILIPAGRHSWKLIRRGEGMFPLSSGPLSFPAEGLHQLLPRTSLLQRGPSLGAGLSLPPARCSSEASGSLEMKELSIAVSSSVLM